MTDALVPHREVVLAPGVVLTPTGAMISDDVSLENWGRALKACQSVANATAWALGDLLVFADDHPGFGERYSQYLDLTGKSYSTLTKAIYLSRQFPPAERVEGVSWSHHAEAAAIKDKQERHTLLHQAKEEGWTREQMRESRTPPVIIDTPVHDHTCPKCGHQWS
jgi:hypothetical protein